MRLIERLSLTCAIVAMLGFVCSAQEGESCPHATGGKPCAGCPMATTTVAADAQQDETCDETSGCCAAKAMENLPKLVFKVGDESACCQNGAEALAKKHNKPIHYVVAEKSYDDHKKAYVALVETTEQFVHDYATPKTCEASGTTSIAGHSCGCPVQAGEYSTATKSIMEKIQLTYVVGDEKCECPKQAASLASANSKEIVYVVGDEKTSCEYTARLNLAHARYKAIVEHFAAKN
ncbi:MAG TPA: hypothetical protein PKD64_04840 [Pirellulaceae bacterium]|nr:hypothetical protein [Pirellulaceae bacterium]HMO91501.1 hypothetical protein [Pirellulaceae bacterium]HMP70974.1 hypothetical protein [Pirellulaceae bacterium]